PGFVVEPLVFVHLVGADRRLDGAFQLHPRYVAVVVVVREKRIGTPGQKRLERRLGGEGGRLAQECRRPRQLGPILDVVRDDREGAARVAPNDGEESGGSTALGFRQSLYPALDLSFLGAFRIIVG